MHSDAYEHVFRVGSKKLTKSLLIMLVCTLPLLHIEFHFSSRTVVIHLTFILAQVETSNPIPRTPRMRRPDTDRVTPILAALGGLLLLGLESLLPVAPYHDNRKETTDDSGEEDYENDGDANGPDARGEQRVENMAIVDKGLGRN